MLVVSPEKDYKHRVGVGDINKHYYETLWLIALGFNFSYVNTISRVRYGIFCVFMTGNLVVSLNCLILEDWSNALIRIAVVVLHIVVGGYLSSYLLDKVRDSLTILKIHWLLQISVILFVGLLEWKISPQSFPEEDISAMSSSGDSLSTVEVVSVLALSFTSGAFAHFSTKKTAFVTQLMTLSMFKVFDSCYKNGIWSSKREPNICKIAAIVLSAISGCALASVALRFFISYSLLPVIVCAPIQLYAFQRVLSEGALLPLAVKDAIPIYTSDSDHESAYMQVQK